ncbi:MAG: DUF2341 domain-containing protein, partial [Candidatus Aenigmatarchaeota archaeon]
SSRYIDWVLVRKYTFPEPTYILGSEESNVRGLEPVWITYFSNVSQAFINSPILFSSLWNASFSFNKNVYLSHFIFSYSLNNLAWINETYSFNFQQNWLSGWQYRIPITIKENSGKNLTDYQVLITLDTASLISANKMKSDCGDIRFTDSDGTTLLNYWIESGCNTNNTRIWIKVPNIPASGTKTIYLYYGNLSATSLSNGDLVFEFFDDFRNANSINTNKWQVTRYSNDLNNECKLSNGVLWLTTKSFWKGCNIRAKNFNIKFNSQHVIHVKWKVDYVCGTSNDGDGIAIIIDGKDTSANNACNKGFYTTYQGIVTEIFNDASSTSSSNGFGIDDETTNCAREGIVSYWSNNWDKRYDLNDGMFEIKLTGSQIIVNYQDYNSANGIKYASISTNVWNPNGNGYFMIGAGAGCSRCGSYYCNQPDSAHGIEYVFIRKYASQEPSVILNNEETNKPFTAWANVTKSFNQVGTLCWRFYANNTLNLWNSTPISCINIISPEFSLEVKLLNPKENSIQNLAVGDYLNVKAQVKMNSKYNFCINLEASLRYNLTSNIPDSEVPSINSIISTNNPQNFEICTNDNKIVDFVVFANKPTFKILDVIFESMNIKNDTKDFFVNVSLIANKELELKAGWNLISIPYKNFILDLSKDECNLKEKVFHYFNSETKKWEYYSYKTITYGKSYWVYAEKDCKSYFAASGNVAPSDLPKAKSGINYIGSTTQPHNLNSIASVINCKNPVARYYDTQNKKFVNTNTIVPWRGYIIECS